MLCNVKSTIKYNGKRYREGQVDLDEKTAAILIARGDVELVQAELPVEAPAAIVTDGEGAAEYVTVETEIQQDAPVAETPKGKKKGGKAKE